MLVVFDLDGTLIDSVQDIASSASELALSLGGRPLDLAEVSELVGDGAALLVRRALTRAGVSPDTPGALDRYLQIYERRLLDTTKPYPGIPEALISASRRARLAVLTNKPLAPSLRLLEAFALRPYFESVIGGDGPHGRKPAPGGLRALARESETVLLVGDSPVDWATAKAASCEFVWARYGFGAARFDGKPPETPWVLQHASDLAAVLDRYGAPADTSR